MNVEKNTFMQYDFRTILKECTKVLLVWEKIRYLKRTSKAIQYFFWNGRLKKEQEVFRPPSDGGL